jgi:hypothetical protein
VGVTVGVVVGVTVGEEVGVTVGEEVGVTVGEEVGVTVGLGPEQGDREIVLLSNVTAPVRA